MARGPGAPRGNRRWLQICVHGCSPLGYCRLRGCLVAHRPTLIARPMPEGPPARPLEHEAFSAGLGSIDAVSWGQPYRFFSAKCSSKCGLCTTFMPARGPRSAASTPLATSRRASYEGRTTENYSSCQFHSGSMPAERPRGRPRRQTLGSAHRPAAAWRVTRVHGDTSTSRLLPRWV